MDLSGITAAILAGGLGTRLRAKVSDRPKVLAEVGARPFLAYLLDQLVEAGCRSVVLCSGYMGSQVERAFGKNYGFLRLVYSQEDMPMGTGGALRLALPHLESDPLLVMNGDSYCDLDLEAFLRWHLRQRSVASVALARVGRSDRYGLVKVGADGQITEFAEKQNDAGAGWINAGIYLLSPAVIQSIPQGDGCSLEKDVFPTWVGRGLQGYMSCGRFIDIGTPEDFAAAAHFFAKLKNGSRHRRFIVLDRDGTIIEEREYLSEPQQVSLISGAGAALRELQQRGFGLVVITNQSGLGRGYFDEEQLRQVHQRLEQLLDQEGVCLDGFYVCPHKPDDDCACRKPKLGLLKQAAAELNFNLEDCIVIGDKPCDIDMGRAAGAMTFLVRTGYGAQFENETQADFVVDDITVAGDSISRLLETGGMRVHGY